MSSSLYFHKNKPKQTLKYFLYQLHYIIILNLENVV